jgi:hypothetical protein
MLSETLPSDSIDLLYRVLHSATSSQPVDQRANQPAQALAFGLGSFDHGR